MLIEKYTNAQIELSKKVESLIKKLTEKESAKYLASLSVNPFPVEKILLVNIYIYIYEKSQISLK